MLWTHRQPLRFTPLAKTSLINSPLVLLVALTLCRGFLYLSIFPPFLGPDEPAHFEAIRLIGQENRWPTRQVYQVTPMHPEMVSVFDRFEIWMLAGRSGPSDLGASNLFVEYYPPQVVGSEVTAESYLMLYHLGMAPLSAGIRSFDLANQVFLLRLVSVIFATLTVIVAWFAIRAMFPARNIFALGACSFIVFWPMHTHLNSSINSDTLAELVGALFFFLVVYIYSRGLSLFRVVLMLGLLIIAIFTKPTLFFLFPTLITILILQVGQWLKWPKITVGLLIGGLVLITWFGGLSVYQISAGGRNPFSILSGPVRFPEWSEFVTRAAFIYYIKSLNFAAVSFGGLFGWSIHIPWSWVKFVALVVGLSAVGILIFIYRELLGWGSQRENLNTRQKELLIIFLIALLFSSMGVFLPIVVMQSPKWGIHSRYYFPVLIPLALYFFIGFCQLVPVRFQRAMWPGWMLGWFVYDIAIFLVLLLPYLYS